MSRPLIASIVLAAAMLVALPALSWAKKAPPADAAEQADKDKDDAAEKDKPKAKKGKAAAAAEDDAETHKKRAKEIGEGKALDKGKTKSGLDKLTGQVDALDKKLKEKGKAPPADEPAPSKKKKAPATQPAEDDPKPEKKKK